MTRKFIFVILQLIAINLWAEDPFYQIERDINLSLENAARLGLEKDQLEVKSVELQKKITEKKTSLLKRSSAQSFLKKYQWGALLSRAESPSQLDRNLKILGRLSEYDLGAFKEYSSSLKMLKSAKVDLDATLQEITKVIEGLKQQQIELNTKESKYLLEVKNKNLPSLLKIKGQLARPLEGLVAWPYGTRVDNSNQYVFVSKGILFKTNQASPVRAVGPGVIIFSDVVEHWRETLIIQHDDNYYSVYSGLKSIKQNVNDSVEKDQLIGLTNSEEFYFELRHFDNPINPKTWFKEIL